MYKCLKITMLVETVPNNFMKNHLQKKAVQLAIEGTAQSLKKENRIKMVIHGKKEAIENFIDYLHKKPGNLIVDDIEVEPFAKDRDYRGAFRIIE